MGRGENTGSWRNWSKLPRAVGSPRCAAASVKKLLSVKKLSVKVLEVSMEPAFRFAQMVGMRRREDCAWKPAARRRVRGRPVAVCGVPV